MKQFKIAQGDGVPLLKIVALDAGQPAIFPEGATATFSMWRDAPKETPVFEADAQIVGSELHYTWGAEDTKQHGAFYGEFRVRAPGQVSRKTYPNGTAIPIIIRKTAPDPNGL